MHPDLNDFEEAWADEIVQWDENTTYSLSRAPDVDPAEEELSLWVSL